MLLTCINNYLWSQVEEAVTPLPRDSRDSKFCHLLPALLALPGAITGALVAARSVISYLTDCCLPYVPSDPEHDFQDVCRDSREWKQLGDLESKITLGQGDPSFLIGPATCTYQDSGFVNCPNSQWADWEREVLPENNRTGRSANLFALYKTSEGRSEIIERLCKLGANSYRFSVEWSQIEVAKGVFNEEVMQIYIDLCIDLRRAGIRPMVTMHHFSEPKDVHAAGSFENEENIGRFVAYCQFLHAKLTINFEDRPLVDLFCTINEPAIEAFSRYVRGAFSPGITWDFERAGIFLKGALKAHQLVYDRLKSVDVQIGITHQRLVFEAANPLLTPVTSYLTRLVNGVTLDYFRTGNFSLKIPFFCNISEKGEKLRADFVGLQYYARPLIGLTGSISRYEPMTQMPMREDPEGLYEAILEVHNATDLPIIITENGISTHDETQRYRYMERALYAAQRAQEEIGQENLLGYYTWSFCDNGEWDMGMEPQAFGAYSLDKIDGVKILKQEPKAGMAPFIRVAQAWQSVYSHHEEQQVV